MAHFIAASSPQAADPSGLRPSARVTACALGHLIGMGDPADEHEAILPGQSPRDPGQQVGLPGADAGDRVAVTGPVWLDVFRMNGRLLGAIDLCRGFERPGALARYAEKLSQMAAYEGPDRYRLAAAKLIPAEHRMVSLRSSESKAAFARLLDEVQVELTRHDPVWARSPHGVILRRVAGERGG